MRRFTFLILLTVSFWIVGCGGDDPTEVETPEPGVILSVALYTAVNQGYDVTRVEAVVSSDGEGGKTVSTVDLSIDGSKASGDIGPLEAGQYELTVRIYTGVPILAQGSQSHTQAAGPPGSVNFSGIAWNDLFPDLPRNVLIIGNSLAMYNGGLDDHLGPLAASADANLVIESTVIAQGGYTLEDHWNDFYVRSRTAIASGDYDVVILQGSPSNMLNNPGNFEQYAALFIDEIEAAGSRAAIFSTPSYKDYPQYATPLRDICQSVADTNSAMRIPVNRAWHRCISERRDIELYDPDRTHPSVHGTYLYLCVIYSALYQRSCFGAEYLNSTEIGGVERNYLQNVAWNETVNRMGW